MTPEVQISDALDDFDWDNFVARNKFSQHEQTCGFARSRGDYYDCFRIKLLSNESIIGGAQILVMRTKIGNVAEIRHGPLFAEKSAHYAERFLGALSDQAKQRSIAKVRLMTMGGEASVLPALSKQGFEQCEDRFSIGATSIVNVDLPEDQVFEGIKRKTRYNIRYAIKKKVEVTEGQKTDLVDFYRLHKITAEQKGFPIYPIEHFHYLWDLYDKHGKIHLLLAKHAGETVAANVVVPYGERLCRLWSSAARMSPDPKAGYLLDWETIRLARRLGLAEYDLCSIDLESRTGPTAYKRSFGGYDLKYPDSLEKYYGVLPSLKRSVCNAVLEIKLSRKIINKVINLDQPRLPF